MIRLVSDYSIVKRNLSAVINTLDIQRKGLTKLHFTYDDALNIIYVKQGGMLEAYGNLYYIAEDEEVLQDVVLEKDRMYLIYFTPSRSRIRINYSSNFTISFNSNLMRYETQNGDIVLGYAYISSNTNQLQYKLYDGKELYPKYIYDWKLEVVNDTSVSSYVFNINFDSYIYNINCVYVTANNARQVAYYSTIVNDKTVQVTCTIGYGSTPYDLSCFVSVGM